MSKNARQQLKNKTKYINSIQTVIYIDSSSISIQVNIDYTMQSNAALIANAFFLPCFEIQNLNNWNSIDIHKHKTNRNYEFGRKMRPQHERERRCQLIYDKQKRDFIIYFIDWFIFYLNDRDYVRKMTFSIQRIFDPFVDYILNDNEIFVNYSSKTKKKL